MARNQAEAHVGIMADMMGSHFATSQDLKDLRIELSQDINKVRVEVIQEMSLLRAEMQNIEYRMTIKLGAIVTVIGGSIATIITLFLKLA